MTDKEDDVPRVPAEVLLAIHQIAAGNTATKEELDAVLKTPEDEEPE